MTQADDQTTADDLCLNVADGHKLNFIIAALTKRTLQIPGIKPADRLTLLEKLNGMTDDWFTADMLAGIEPMDDTGVAIYEQARTLDPADDKTHAASFKVLATPSVFQHFVKLNPSIASAIEQRAAGRRDTPPAPPDEIPRPRPQTVMGAAQFAHAAPLQWRSTNAAPLARSAGPDWPYGRRLAGLVL